MRTLVPSFCRLAVVSAAQSAGHRRRHHPARVVGGRDRKLLADAQDNRPDARDPGGEVAGGGPRGNHLPEGEAAPREQRDARGVCRRAGSARDTPGEGRAQGDGLGAPQLPQSDGRSGRCPSAPRSTSGCRPRSTRGRPRSSSGSRRQPSSSTMMGPDIVIPAGAIVRGFVSSVRVAGKIDRRGSLTLSFDELRDRGTVVPATRLGDAGARRQDGPGHHASRHRGCRGRHHRRHPWRRQGRAPWGARRRRRDDRGHRRHRRRLAGRHHSAHSARSAAADRAIESLSQPTLRAAPEAPMSVFSRCSGSPPLGARSARTLACGRLLLLAAALTASLGAQGADQALVDARTRHSRSGDHARHARRHQPEPTSRRRATTRCGSRHRSTCRR